MAVGKALLLLAHSRHSRAGGAAIPLLHNALRQAEEAAPECRGLRL
jgi:hypothetical protein